MRQALLMLLILEGVLPGNAQRFYISPQGDDANPGTLEKPFATPGRARQAVRGSRRDGSPVIIFFRRGVYYLSESFVLEQKDGGTKDAPVVYTAYNNEPVSIRGSKMVRRSAFGKVRDKGALLRIKPALRDSIVVLDLKPLNLKHINAYSDKFDDDGGIIELFMDERRMPLSRYPNRGFMTIKKVIVNGGGQESKNSNWGDYYSDNAATVLPPQPGVFEYRDIHENNWINAVDRGVWIKGFWRIPWQNEAVRIGKIDTQAHIITLSAPISGGIGSKYNRPEGNGKEPYWLMNLLEEIDSPGEWAVDFKEQRLYFYPPAKITDSNVRIADNDEALINLDNVAFIQLKGLLLEENMGDGVKISGGEGNLVAGCTVRDMTHNAITIDGGKDHTILSNDLYDLGAGGVWLKGGDENTVPKTSANFKVVNNHIFHYSQLTRIYAAGINAGFTGGGGGGHHAAVGMYIAHNLVHDAPHVGILFGSWNSTFEYNEIYDYCQVSDDMGAFYSYDQYDRMGGHTFAYNFIHNSPLGDGIYFDNDHRDMHIYGNIIALYNYPNRRGTAFLYKSGSQAKDGHEQAIDCYNNIAVHCNYGFQFVVTKGTKNHIDNNISILNGTFFRNRLLGKDNKESDISSIPDNSGRNMMYLQDPGFENLAGFDLRLKPGSVIFTDLPGFRQIPFKKMGLFVDEYRKRLPDDDAIKRFTVMPGGIDSGSEILDRK